MANDAITLEVLPLTAVGDGSAMRRDVLTKTRRRTGVGTRTRHDACGSDCDADESRDLACTHVLEHMPSETGTETAVKVVMKFRMKRWKNRI